MRVATIPLSAKPFDWDRNTQLAWRAIQDCGGADLVLLPELFAAGYCYNRKIKAAAEPRNGTTVEWMRAASHAFDTHIGGTFIELIDGAVYNTFALVSPSGAIEFYRKTSLPLFERFYFRGATDSPILDTELGRIGVLICWDLTSRQTIEKLRGNVDMVLVPMAWPDTTRGNISLPFVGRRLAAYPFEVPEAIAADLNVPVVVCNMAGEFRSRIPTTMVTYSADYVNSSCIIVPTSLTPQRIAANGQTLSVDLDQQAIELPSRSLAVAHH